MPRFILLTCLMTCLICLINFVVPSQVSAQLVDVIYLKDGRVVRGKILEKSDGLVSVQMEDGRVDHFFMDQVTRIEEQSLSNQGQSRMGGEQSRMRGKKNVYGAMALSFFIIGSGQIYNGQALKGVGQFGLAVVGYTYMRSGSGDDYYFDDYYLGKGDGNNAKFAIGLVLWGGTWIWSIVDAGMTASRINKENQYGHLIELGDDRFAFGVDPVVQPNRLGTMLTFHF